MPSSTRLLGFASLPLLLSLWACGGRGTFHDDVFAGRGARYHVGAPDTDWRRLSVDSHNDLAWGRGDFVIQVNHDCDPELDIPLEVLTRHLLIGFTDRDVSEQTRVPMAGREALRTHVVAKLDGVPREMLFYVLKKDGCVYDLALIAAPGASFADARTAFERVVGGFRTEGGPS